jgi:hypothetical protein
LRAGREAALAVAAAVAWAIGAALTTRVGIWPAMGGTALVVASVVAALDRARLVVLVRPSLARVVGGAAVGVVMAGATHALHPPVVAALPVVAAEIARLYGAFSSVPAPFAAALLLPGALVYAAAHAPTRSPLLVAAALACGLVWGALRARTGGLVAPFFAHLVWDALVLLVWPI